MTNGFFQGDVPKATVDGQAKYWSGHQALSMVLPERLNLEYKTYQYDENLTDEQNKEHILKIKNGQILSGCFDKSVYQARSKGIIHTVFNEYGCEETTRLFDHTQKLICDWLVYSGFSVGVSDLAVESSTQEKFKETIRKMKVNAYDIIKTIHDGRFENNSTYNNHVMFERKVIGILNDANKNVGNEGLKNIRDENNRLINMIKSKSKGNTINVAQMIGCVGQQNVDGKRIPYGFEDRTLPHYTKYDDGPESRGFVENSFIKGLTPQEFFFHAMGGREGLIDTAVQTSEVGYTQRKLVKAMEDCKVNYDYSVRNASGVIIQFLYGEDGIDSCKLENQQIPTITMDPAKITAVYGGTKKDFKGFIGTDIYNSLPEDTLNQRMQQHLDQLMADREHLIINVFKGKDDNTLLYPVAFYRMINTITNLYEGSVEVSYDLSPLYVLDTIETLCNELKVSRSHPGNRLLQCLLRVNLSPKKLICQYHLTHRAFDALVAQIRFRFEESLASPSEMVGVIAAQSIGEPATQLVLNSFHMSGTAVAAQATRGVPRLNELLSVSKNIKTPIMHIYLHESFRSDKKQVMKYMNDIRTVRFRDIVSKVQLFYDPNDFNTGIPEDTGFIETYRRFMTTADLQNYTSSHPWLLRMEMDKSKMLEFNVDMITLHHVLTNFYDDTIQCMFSDDNADKLIMRIKLTDKEISSDDILTDMKALEHNILENVMVKGIKSVERVAPDEKKYKQYNPQTQNFEDAKEWVIYTSGTNLREVLIKPHVDAVRTVTNDVNEVYEILGIEAARNSLYNEIKDVLDGGMVTVNYRHLSLLVDVMTNRGNILSVNRHGINRGDIGPLAKCSFEETTDKLIKAGIFAEHDKINGVSANVMLGQIAPCGTGDVTVLMDEEILAKMTATSQLATIQEEDESGNTCDIATFKTTLPPVSRDSTIAKKEANDFEIV